MRGRAVGAWVGGWPLGGRAEVGCPRGALGGKKYTEYTLRCDQSFWFKIIQVEIVLV